MSATKAEIERDVLLGTVRQLRADNERLQAVVMEYAQHWAQMRGVAERAEALWLKSDSGQATAGDARELSVALNALVTGKVK